MSPFTLDAHSQFAGISLPGVMRNEEQALMNMIHDSGGHEDIHVEESSSIIKTRVPRAH